MDNKIKVFVMSDHPMSPSGVGTQTRYMIEGLLKTGKFKFYCFGGAIKHHDYRITKTEEWGDDFLIQPVDGYGSEETVRGVLRNYRPDIVWFMTDPRFWGWLWQMEDEIRPLAPMVYYHVWDNYPYPKFNKVGYDSNDAICTISKVTDDIVRTVAPEVDCYHVPHSIDTSIFKKGNVEELNKFRDENLAATGDPRRMIFFWNNRNARRKMSGSIIYWFKEFLDEIGHDKASLLMHTDAKDPNGQDLEHIIEELGMDKGQVMISPDKITPQHLALLYNMADCTINISDAEGFGLATLESLACETPILVNMTGGLQEQVTDGKDWFGIGIHPSSKAIIGSQDVPYIYEDRVSKEDFIAALLKMYNMTDEERAELGRKGRQHIENNYNFDIFNKNWETVLTEIHEKYGSWENRKNYTPWTVERVL